MELFCQIFNLIQDFFFFSDFCPRAKLNTLYRKIYFRRILWQISLIFKLRILSGWVCSNNFRNTAYINFDNCFGMSPFFIFITRIVFHDLGKVCVFDLQHFFSPSFWNISWPFPYYVLIDNRKFEFQCSETFSADSDHGNNSHGYLPDDFGLINHSWYDWRII